MIEAHRTIHFLTCDRDSDLGELRLRVLPVIKSAFMVFLAYEIDMILSISGPVRAKFTQITKVKLSKSPKLTQGVYLEDF